ncbi:hypothetical protein [Paraburkholderia aspalathi]|uniref:hypothetical protein n=1 Tax=Paraburkholderia aspalathi TaxID=1324617 RepID=UPI001B268AA2|nr:hypothetical protein [Paraburkholderia aspalathi]CAE6841650.1 hypothetical protein R20943_07139 [Paraburkholderia aspalathi]
MIHFPAFHHVAIRAIAAYLTPAILGAVLLARFARGNAFFALVSLPGNLAHELLHFCLGFVTFARPVSLSVWPRRAQDGSYVFGSVLFENVRWWNAAPASLAPMLGYGIAVAVAAVRLRNGYIFWPWDLAVWGALAQLIFAAWPSTVDWRLSLKSWPLFLAGPGAFWFYYTHGFAAG